MFPTDDPQELDCLPRRDHFIALLTGAVAERFLREDVERVESEVGEVGAVEDELVNELTEVRRRLDRIETLLARRG